MSVAWKGFNLDLRTPINFEVKRIYQRLCYHATGTVIRTGNQFPFLSDLPYVEISGNAPVLPGFNGTLLLS